MFNDIESTKNGHNSECILKSREQSDYAKKKSARTLVIPWSWRWTKHGMERAISSQKRKWTSKPIKWLKNSHRVAIPCSEIQVAHPRTLEAKIRNYSHDSGLRKHWVNDATVLQQISSVHGAVSVGVAFGWQDARSEICRSEYVHFRINMNSYHNSWIRKKFALW